MRLFVYIEKNKMQESVWVSGCAAVLAGRSESRICFCCLTSVGQNPIRVGSASCHVVIIMTNFQYWKQHSKLAGVAGTAVLNLSTALEHLCSRHFLFICCTWVH